MAEQNSGLNKDLLNDILANQISYQNTLRVIYNYCKNSMQVYGVDQNPQNNGTSSSEETIIQSHTEVLDGLTMIRDFIKNFMALYNKYKLDSYTYFRDKIQTINIDSYTVYYEETKEKYTNNTGVDLSPDNYDKGIPFLEYEKNTFASGQWLDFLSELLNLNFGNVVNKFNIQMSVYDIDVPIYKPIVNHILDIEPVIILPNFNSKLVSSSEILPKIYVWSISDTFVDSNMLTHIIVYLLLKQCTLNQLMCFAFTSRAMPLLTAIISQIKSSNVYTNDELNLLQSITKEIQNYNKTTQIFANACELIRSQIFLKYDNQALIRYFVPEIYNKDEVVQEFWNNAHENNYTILKDFITNYPLKIGYEVTAQQKQNYIYNGTHAVESNLQTRLASNGTIQTTSAVERIILTQSLINQLNPIRQQIRIIDGSISSITVNINDTTGIVDYTSNATASLNLDEKEEIRRIALRTSSWDDAMSVANFLKKHNIFIEQDQSYDVFEINDDFVSELINLDTVAQFSFSYDMTTLRGDLSFTAQNIQSNPQIPSNEGNS